MCDKFNIQTLFDSAKNKGLIEPYYSGSGTRCHKVTGLKDSLYSIVFILDDDSKTVFMCSIQTFHFYADGKMPVLCWGKQDNVVLEYNNGTIEIPEKHSELSKIIKSITKEVAK